MLVQFFSSHCSYSAVHSEFRKCTAVILKFSIWKICSIPVWACLIMQYLKPDEKEQVGCHTFWSVWETSHTYSLWMGRIVTPLACVWGRVAHNTCSLLLEGISISALGWKGGIIKFVVDSYICNNKIWFLSRWFLIKCCACALLVYCCFRILWTKQ